MSLTSQDVKTIREVLREEIRPIVKQEVHVEISSVKKQLKSEMKILRSDMYKGFRKQSEHVSKTISDAINLSTENQTTREEFEEIIDKNDELDGRVKSLEYKAKES